MRINPQALERVKGARLSGDGVAATFQELFKLLERFPDAEAAMSLVYQDKDDVVEEHDLIPVITLSFRPAS